MGPNMMLPLLLMDDDSDNESLMFYLMMSQNRPEECGPNLVEPVRPAETVFRTWRVNPDGTKTLVDETTEE